LKIGHLRPHFLSRLPHEHLLIDFTVMFSEPAAASDKGRAWEPLSLANLGWVRQHFNANLDNLRLTDEQVAREEILLFKHAGGRTVIDPTPRSLARDPLALARIARATGLNIVMGAGYYVAAAHPPDLDRRGVDDLAREITADVTTGVGDTGICSGLIGELGCTWPWEDNEKKVVRAGIAAQQATGAPLMIHPGATSGRRWRSPSSSGRKAATCAARSCATSAVRSPTSGP
jgi:phosphotriesterase-related protein